MSASNILVISDTHGNVEVIKQLLENYRGMVSAVVHLGDHARDMLSFAKADKDSDMYHIVNGNVETSGSVYNERVIEMAGKRLFITHGHPYDVKTSLDNLIYKAQELQVDACLFGHTHVALNLVEKGILFFNPGSPTYPRPGQDRGYGLLSISEEGAIVGRLLEYRPATGDISTL